MGNDIKRQQQRQRLMNSKLYQYMLKTTRYMDRYYLDALIGIIPGWGDAIALLSTIPFIYFSTRVIRSIPLSLAIICNALRDVLLGMIPFFVGDIIDIFYRSNVRNMAMIQGFVNGDQDIIKSVNRKAWQVVGVIIILLLLIALMVWLLIVLSRYLVSLF